ncbi:polyketide cyclase / dehydrase and lipid transport [Rhodococcus sp. G-MC3]|uniref:polyketide cyclase / dehydrase and lipid transport n=1 Tax=Rhodococcus sp. G-MC3 TaxID=3046209 RepID=UPI0024BB4415|nr:polyketide cyclase / dehydrase and lipid transport [Rhodococcus sp. G-MC3]MDJ0393058.1 polyketide cyclase / dehydrase and lipid transport [Rhodococcus sp. G-MC3]
MSSIQVADQTFVAAAAETVAETIGAPNRWRLWWPDLSLDVTDDRADRGIRWRVGGALTGTMEVWLEPMPVLHGVILHYFLHAEPAAGTTSDLLEEIRRRRAAGKAMAFEVKRRLEAGRAAGERPVHADL